MPAPGAGGPDASTLVKLQQVADAALAHLSVEELLEELLVRVRDVFAADTCAILLLDEAGNELVARAAKGLEEEVEQGIRIPVGAGFAGRIVASRRPLAIEDVDHADVLNPILREKGVKSLLGAPLLARGRPLGVIHVGMLRHRVFTADETELLKLAAERAALGLERAIVHEQLLELDRIRHRFVSVAAHELRAPATAVYVAAATLDRLRASLGDEKRLELERTVVEQSHRLVEVIDQLLDLSRLESRNFEPKPRPVRLRDRLEKVARSVAGDETPVAVACRPDLVVAVDPVALDRVVGNLVQNALRHGGPPVTVAAGIADETVRIVVEDRGPGIRPEFRARLFDDFARDESTDAPGSGLGLPIARSYARAHGGDLTYADAQPSGARFEFAFPLEEPPAAGGPPPGGRAGAVSSRGR